MNHETLNTNSVKYLDWDSKFFGFPIGRIHALGCTEMLLMKSLAYAEKEKIQFIELFCDASDSQSIQASEDLAFHLADVRFTFTKKLKEDLQNVKDDNTPSGLTFKKAGSNDINDLKIAGRGLFANSRYYNYPYFDKGKVDLMFQTWIEKAVRGEWDDELYYLADKSGILAFNSFRKQGSATSIGLFGVNEAHQGKGLGSLLLNKVSQLIYNRRVTEVNVVTQGRNANAVHLYQKNRFILSKITLCYYKWLEFNEDPWIA